MRYPIFIFLLALLDVSRVSAAKFYPASDQILFDVSRISLDVDSMISASSHLTIVASRFHDQMDPVQLRTNAQLLYLAKQLHPKNLKVIDLTNDFVEADQTPFESSERVRDSVKFLASLTTYLARNNANAPDTALALYLKDVLKGIAPELSETKYHSVDPKRLSHLPDLSAYKQPGIRPKPKDEVEEPEAGEDEANTHLPEFRRFSFEEIDPDRIMLGISLGEKGRINRLKRNNDITDSNVEWNFTEGVRSMSFGKNSYVRFNKGGKIRADQSFTLEALVYLNEAQEFGTIISKFNPKSNFKGWDLAIKDKIINFELNHSYPNNTIHIKSGDELPLKQWVYVVVQYDGSLKSRGISLFINGKESAKNVIKDSLTNDIFTDVNLHIGSRSDESADFHNGNIAHIRLSDGILGMDIIEKTAEKFQNGRTSQNAEKPTETVLLQPTEPVIPDENEQAEPDLSQPLKPKLSHFSILSPMTQYEIIEEEKHKSTLVLANINFEDQGSTEEKELFISPQPWSDSLAEGMGKHVYSGLKQTYPNLSGFRIKLSLASHYSGNNAGSISGPIAIAVGCSLLGEKIPSNTVVCASVKGKDLVRPKELWSQFRMLTNPSHSHRILVGKGGGSDFKQLLAEGNIGFFIKNEVLQVSTIKEGVDAAANLDPIIKKASEMFQEMQKLYDEGDIGRMASDSATRENLNKIVTAFPGHVSAQMILLWGGNERPKTYDKIFSTIELRAIFKRIEGLKEREHHAFYNGQEYADKAKESLALHEKVVHKDLKTTFQEIESCIPLIESISRNHSSRPRTAEQNLIALKEKIQKIQKELDERFEKERSQRDLNL
jgi:hypothetical protein